MAPPSSKRLGWVIPSGGFDSRPRPPRLGLGLYDSETDYLGEQTIWKIEPRTAAKHELLKHYLGAWFPILASREQRIIFLDGFAGLGSLCVAVRSLPFRWLGEGPLRRAFERLEPANARLWPYRELITYAAGLDAHLTVLIAEASPRHIPVGCRGLHRATAAHLVTARVISINDRRVSGSGRRADGVLLERPLLERRRPPSVVATSRP